MQSKRGAGGKYTRKIHLCPNHTCARKQNTMCPNAHLPETQCAQITHLPKQNFFLFPLVGRCGGHTHAHIVVTRRATLFLARTRGPAGTHTHKYSMARRATLFFTHKHYLLGRRGRSWRVFLFFSSHHISCTYPPHAYTRVFSFPLSGNFVFIWQLLLFWRAYPYTHPLC